MFRQWEEGVEILNPQLRTLAMAAIDGWMAVVPRRQPDAEALMRCRIVSHRGEHGRNGLRENTLRAFETARAASVWGIEADIRWTADQVPVIIHDPDTNRVFGRNLVVAETAFEVLRNEIAEIPSLAELIAEFGGNTHLMLELKAEEFPRLESQKRILRDQLCGLTPRDDYHILALDPSLFETFDIRPRTCCLPVAEENSGELSRLALSRGYGGLTGHYLLLNEKLRREHERSGQKLGTGFIRSRNCAYREINRGIEWLFTNDAVRLQQTINRHAQR